MKLVTGSKGEDLSARTERMSEEFAQTVAIRWLEGFDLMARRCESPIERHLMLALMSQAETAIEEIDFSARVIDFENFAPYPMMEDEKSALVFTQVDVGPYRVDIMVYDQSRSTKPARWIAVECDGHQYHEKTKEQAKRDKQRDRYFARRGITVLRFTGSEIYADAEQCADEIIDTLVVNSENI